MSGVVEEALDGCLEAIERARGWSPRVISKLEAFVRGAEDLALFRANPREFATETRIDEAEAIELFLHATHAGLFTMAWSVVCPTCVDVVDGWQSLATVHTKFHCTLCQSTMETTLDEHLHVGFTISPRVRAIAHHDPSSLEAVRWTFEFKASRDGFIPGGPRMLDFLRQASRFVAFLAPGEVCTFSFEAPAGHVLVGYDMTSDATLRAPVGPGGATSLAVEYRAGACAPAESRFAPGPVELTITNASNQRGHFGVMAFPVREGGRTAAAFPRVLTAHQLLANQTFRTLFRSEVLRDDGIAVHDATLLFTDLKGSTALYERIGDLQAFTLVRQHFDAIGRAVARHHGAVVKTIGDAVMAAFTTPTDAVAAALQMLDDVERVNAQLAQREVILKVGVHRGPAIAVTANDRVDYFGQTVNVAARVQGLAGADEIWMTDVVATHDGVGALLEGRQVEARRERVKGVGHELALSRVLAR